MVKSSIAMTGAAKKMLHIVEENVFPMLQVCHSDMGHLQVGMESQKFVVKVKNAAMMVKLILNTSLPLIHSAVFWMKLLIWDNIRIQELLHYVVAKINTIFAVPTIKLLTARTLQITSVVKMASQIAMEFVMMKTFLAVPQEKLIVTLKEENAHLITAVVIS